MRIAFNTYSPALTDNTMTSSATGLWFSSIIRHFANLGHEVWNVSVGEMTDRKDSLDRVFANPVDLIILIWRWPMDEELYPRRAAAYERQLELIDLAIQNKTPVLIHDEDYKEGAIEAHDLLNRSGVRCFLTSPALKIIEPYRWLPFPLIHSRWTPKASLSNKFYDFVYVGNNYERYDQMKAFLNNPANKYASTHIYGNWLIPSETRQSPEQVKQDFPTVTFFDPVPQDKVLNILVKYFFTAHFAKPEYCKTGFITMRWQEAVSAGTLAFVPDEFWLPPEIESRFKGLNQNKLLDPIIYNTTLAYQYQYIRALSDIDEWTRILDDLVN